MISVNEMMKDWERKDKDCCVYTKHPKPKKILLECGTCPQDAIFEIRRGRVRRRQQFVLDRVLVDTSCLCRPQTKIEFSSIVSFEAEARGRYYGRAGTDEELENEVITEADEVAEEGMECGRREKEVEVDLEFELIRVCDGVEECVRKWRYKKEFEIKYVKDFEVEISEPFTVTFCDRACPGCCVYKMIVKGKDFDGRFESMKVVTPDLSALAQGICGD